MNRKDVGTCPLCKRTTRLTFHHLIPRKMHRRNHFKKRYNKHTLQSGIFICRECHSAIHRFYDEMTLAKQYASLEALCSDDRLQQHFSWLAKRRIKVV